MNFFNRVVKILLIFILVISTVTVSSVQAIEENIYDVPLSDFNNLVSASERLERTLEDWEKNKGIIGYQMFYMQDMFVYKYHILNVAEKLGNNTMDIIPEHIVNFNQKIRAPLTDTFEIKATINNDNTYTIDTVKGVAQSDLVGLIKYQTDLAEEYTYMNQLEEIRNELGLTNLTDMFDGKDGDLQSAIEYLEENTTHIRFLFTAMQTFMTEYIAYYDPDLVELVKDTFVHTYDNVLYISALGDIKDLSSLNLFGESSGAVFDPSGEEPESDIGEWSEPKDGESPELLKHSEYILKGIAASSVFRPFDTNLNSLDSMDFLGDEMLAFHEAYGVKRKLVITVTDGYNNLNNGANLKAAKDLKYMTLSDFVNTNTPTIMYIDNLQYNGVEEAERINEITNQNPLNKKDVEIDEDSATDQIADNNNESWFDKAKSKGISFIQDTKNSNFITNKLIPASIFGIGSKEAMLEDIIFMSGDITKLGTIDSNLKTYKEKVNRAYVLHKNIIEEFYDATAKVKMVKDLDKPIYVDIYGNIVSSSGIVLIPAMANPFMAKGDDNNFNFNVAFVESYPKYSIKNGQLVARDKDKGKLAYGMVQMTESEIKDQEDEFDENYDIDVDDTGDLNQEGEDAVQTKTNATVDIDNEGALTEPTDTVVNNFTSETWKAIPGVKFYVTKANGSPIVNKSQELGYVAPIANKFSASYEPTKAIDIYSFMRINRSTLESYTQLRSNLSLQTSINNKLLISDYTVKLNFEESSENHLVSFLEMPNTKEIKRFMYTTNLERLIEIDNGEIKSKETLSPKSRSITGEVYLRGIYDLEQINSLAPEIDLNSFEEYEEFLINLSDSRYSNSMSETSVNNLMYSSSVDEVQVTKDFLPLIYRMVLLITLFGIIMNIILLVINSDDRVRQAIRLLTTLYVAGFILSMSGFVNTYFINKPTAKIFNEETNYWTLVEQEQNSHLKKMTAYSEVDDREEVEGSVIKLYKVPYTYPYKLALSKQEEGKITVDEFYESFLHNDNRFRAQNNEMFMDGSYLVTRTKTIFDSSSIVVENQEDPKKKLVHEIYYEPELAYYLPYYMFIDNMVYNLNLMQDINPKVPHVINYASGAKKTAGRLNSYINSALFLDYEEFEKRLENFEPSGDVVQDELYMGALKNAVESYGEYYDFLGIRKIVGLRDDTDLEPFNREQLDAVQITGWYPYFEDVMDKKDAEKLEKKALKVNEKVRKYMLSLSEVSNEMADEHLIKSIALYASLEFNKEFGSYARNIEADAIEMKGVSFERLLMGLSMPREDLLTNTLSSYPNYIKQEMGYIGLTLSSINDMLILAISYVKPIILAFVWIMSALVIYLKKIILPDPDNRSIVGSFKLLALYSLLCLSYNVGLLLIIKYVNLNFMTGLSQLWLIILNALFIYGLIVIIFALVKDTWNLGNSMLFKGLERNMRYASEIFKGSILSLPLVEKYFGRQVDIPHQKMVGMQKYFEQQAIRSIEDNSFDARAPINFSKALLSKAPSFGNKDNNTHRGSDLLDDSGYVNLPEEQVNRPVEKGRVTDYDQDAVLTVEMEKIKQGNNNYKDTTIDYSKYMK